ncbi:MAG: heavy metal translocating P-type ATPase metal-binding domain-containing protein [Christiangramia sp.]|nr:heavy metal translocating P-type ATPase [Christiangramia sp.]
MNCYHCGEECQEEHLYYKDKNFCCNGCKTVFEILETNDLSYYYELEQAPGISPKTNKNRFAFLDDAEIAAKFLEFQDGDLSIVSFLIPSMHCSSCIWILENLKKLEPGIQSSQVDFPRKTIRLSFRNQSVSLREVVILLTRLGYEPNISLDNFEKKEEKVDRQLIYRLGVAGFAFGNIMFLSFPEYFELREFWLEQFKPVFRWLMFFFSLPVVFYAASDYFSSAYKGLRSKMLNIDIPIALGIIVLFIRSSTDILLNLGSGFFDSLSGLVFFLLLGKFFQQKTYRFLSFERDYKSYFPIAVTRLRSENGCFEEEQVQVYQIRKGDRIVIRNAELIPMDGLLLSEEASIDYSFVTGEAEPVSCKKGDHLFAGGRQQGGLIEIETTKEVKQSYLTQLWSHESFTKKTEKSFKTLTDQISRRFTLSVISIAILSGIFWLFYDSAQALDVFTAVLIIACPCAIALAAPFTLGNLLRIFGKNRLYLKNASVIEKMAGIDTIIFDKTGTITATGKKQISYEGITLSEEELELLSSSLRASNHPLSRSLYALLKRHHIKVPEDFEEIPGKGILSRQGNNHMKIGSTSLLGQPSSTENFQKTQVHISNNEEYKGYFTFQNLYREGTAALFQQLSKNYEVILLSGDNQGEERRLKEMLPKNVQMHFNQKPGEKLEFVKRLQQQGRKVMMVGDGLNDAGALAASDVGIAISEDINVFSPACDGIIDARSYQQLGRFLKISQGGISIIQWSFLLSLAYNLVGLGFAISGNLMPVVAAILMPLSSISVVVFTTFLSNLISRKIKSV